MMKKYWLVVAGSALLAAGCVNKIVPYSGAIQEMRGAPVHYEQVNPLSLQNYSANGKNYKILTKPAGFREQGVASWFTDDLQDQKTFIGETIDNYDIVGAHPTLPLPSYVSVTNMNNGRQLIVRLIARSPFKDGTVITLSQAAASRLLLTEQTPIQVDYVDVAPDGSVSGELARRIEAVQQSYPLPALPDIGAQ